MSKSSNFQPNWASTPGDTIADILKDRQLTLPMFAKKMNSTIDHVRELLHGYVSITEEIAQKLEKVLGASVEFWLKRESQYRDSVYRLRNVEEEKWFKEYDIYALSRPISDLDIPVGHIGTILMIHNSAPIVYKVEFSDKNGYTLAQIPLTEDYMRIITEKEKELLRKYNLKILPNPREM